MSRYPISNAGVAEGLELLAEPPDAAGWVTAAGTWCGPIEGAAVSDGAGRLRALGTAAARRALLGCGLLALVPIGCGGDSDEASGPPTPRVAVTLSSSDERASALPESGDRTTFRGRVTRGGRPLRHRALQLLADLHPFGDGERVVARARTGADGRFVVRERFDRRTRVRARVGDGHSPAVELARTADLGRADVEGQANGDHLMTGILRYPEDVQPRFRFRLFVGLRSQPRLPRRPAVADFESLGPGRGRVSVRFRPPASKWQAFLCVFPAEETGLSGPRRDCRGRTRPNTAYERDEARRREEEEARRREQDAGGDRD